MELRSRWGIATGFDLRERGHGALGPSAKSLPSLAGQATRNGSTHNFGEQNAVFCSRRIPSVNPYGSQNFSAAGLVFSMNTSLFDGRGNRKYLTAEERAAFVAQSLTLDTRVGDFCLTLAITGARISEVLGLTQNRIDANNSAIVFRTLKQRSKVVYRAVPVPNWLARHLASRVLSDSQQRIWLWGRTTAWKIVRQTMLRADIPEFLCMPKSLRHAFAVEAGQNGVPLNVVQNWLGHARIETTAIYSSVLGREERRLAQLTWKNLIPRAIIKGIRVDNFND